MHLVAAAQTGDAEAMEQLLGRHIGDLRAFVRAKSSNVIRQHESCSDLVQTVCREVLGGIDGYEWRGEGSFRHWLFAHAWLVHYPSSPRS
jgi:DNA-directed RNA polymerase specialized sigma24 family protein